MANANNSTGESRSRTFWKFLGYVKPYKAWLLLGISLAAIVAGLQLYLPWILKLIFDSLTGARPHPLLQIVLLLVVVAVSSSAVETFRGYAFVELSERVLAELRNELCTVLRRLPLSHFQKEQTGRIMSVLTHDAPAMARVYNPILSEAFQSILQLLLAFAVLTLVFRWLVLFAPVACAIYLIVPSILTKKLRELHENLQATNAQFSAELQESISATREVKAFNREQWDLKRLAKSIGAFLPLHRRVSFLQIVTLSNTLLYWLIAGSLYWLGGRRVLAGTMSVGSLFALVWYFSFLDVPVRRLVNLHGQLQAALAAADRVFDVLKLESSAVQPAVTKSLSCVGGRIRFDSVSFAYDNGKSVLTGVSFIVDPGQRVAIVGPSGTGKSTLASLILGLHNISAGHIYIDEQDTSEIALESLRKHIGVVFQDTFLFNTSVRENIQFGRLDATDAEVVAAAKAANAHNFIMELPHGYDTEVGERGAALSGGQRQRIAISRAILLDPHILILDEATSALDPEAEAAVCEALENLMRGRTNLIIAQRLSTIADSDRIVVLDQGRVAELGKHRELMRNGGWYRKNYEMQLALDDEIGVLDSSPDVATQNCC